jgi:hypothetical protein
MPSQLLRILKDYNNKQLTELSGSPGLESTDTEADHTVATNMLYRGTEVHVPTFCHAGWP